MRFIDEMEGLVSSQISVIKTGLSLTRLEARLAMLSVFPLIINVCFLLVTLVGLWLTTMGMLGYGLMQVFHNVLIAMSGVLGFNVIMTGLLLKYLSFNLKNMSFQKTRAHLSRGKDEPTKAGDDSDSHSGQAILEPTESAQ